MDNKTCEWCATEISSSALKCPSCGGWRKEITNNKIICYSSSLLFGVLFGWGLATGEWATFNQPLSFPKLLNMPTGWILVISLVVALYAYVKVSRRIKTWIWM